MLILSIEEVKNLLEKLLSRYKVYGPVKAKDFWKFEEITNPDEADLGYISTMLPIKKYFLPPFETILHVKLGEDKEITIKEPEVNEKCVLFGVHPCDLKAILLLDKVFLDELKDPYYLKRRENTIIVALNCTAADEFCFCTTFGAGPFAKEGYDLVLTNLDEHGYVLEVGSNKGEELIKAMGFAKVSDEYRETTLKRKEEILRKMESEINQKRRIPNVEKLPELLAKNFNHKVWESMGKLCLACGSCNLVCPTCYCFNIVDKFSINLKEVERIRTWDSCLLLEFAEVALGGNFRRERLARFKQRIYHKLSYFVEQYGEFGCVGCGRCIRWCVRKIDPVKIVGEIIEKPIPLTKEGER